MLPFSCLYIIGIVQGDAENLKIENNNKNTLLYKKQIFKK